MDKQRQALNDFDFARRLHQQTMNAADSAASLVERTFEALKFPARSGITTSRDSIAQPLDIWLKYPEFTDYTFRRYRILPDGVCSMDEEGDDLFIGYIEFIEQVLLKVLVGRGCKEFATLLVEQLFAGGFADELCPNKDCQSDNVHQSLYGENGRICAICFQEWITTYA